MTNTFQSDLVPGFNLSLTHDLWNGPVGFDASHFDLFLAERYDRFCGLQWDGKRGAAVVRSGQARKAGNQRTAPALVCGQPEPQRPSPSFYTSDNNALQPGFSSRRFTANFNYTLSRYPPDRQPFESADSAESGLQHVLLSDALVDRVLVVPVQHHR